MSKREQVLHHEADRNKFDEFGFCLVEHSQLIHVAGAAKAIFDADSDSYMAATFRSSFQVANKEKRRRTHRRLLNVYGDFVEQLLISYRLVCCGFAVKQPSGHLSTLHLHQDISISDWTERRPAVTLWIPLQDVSEINGRLGFIPKTSFVPTLPRAYGDNKDWLDRHPELEHELVEVSVKLGQAIIFDQRILHQSGPNLSDRTRVAVMLLAVPNESDVVVYRVKDEDKAVTDLSPISVHDSFYVEEPLQVRFST